MSNRSISPSNESIKSQALEKEQRIILHNNLLQRILKLRDKIGTSMSLTELSRKLIDLETMVYGGCDLEEIDIEIISIENIVILHLNNSLYSIRHPGQAIVTNTKKVFQPKDISQKIKTNLEKKEL